MCLIVVDESVLALSGYAIQDPLNTFYPVRPEERPAERFANRKDISVEVQSHPFFARPSLEKY